MDGMCIDHLSFEAIAALVDGELSHKAEHRAKLHLVHCSSCREEVHIQREASQRLRADQWDACASGSLIERLKSIPDNCPDDSDIPEHEKHYGIARDGCRRPETFTDYMDLLVRRIGRKN